MILVLNSAYMPVNVTSLKRAFKLVFLNKAEIIEFDELNPIKTTYAEFKRPVVIKLKRYVYVKYKDIKFNKENIFKRDDFKCVYCGSNKNLTIDHVIPKSKGGKHIWKNVVTCCKKCNNDKDDHLLDDLEINLPYMPYKPNYLTILVKNKPNRWNKYLMK